MRKYLRQKHNANFSNFILLIYESQSKIFFFVNEFINFENTQNFEN